MAKPMRWSLVSCSLVGSLVAVGGVCPGQPRSCSPGSSQPVDLDKYADQTSPQALTALHNSANQSYSFRHLSDVDVGPSTTDPKSKMLIYTHIVKNDHAGRLLPFEWPAAGIGYKQELKRGESFSNCFNTPAPPRVDFNATIVIGSSLKIEEPARTYVEDPTQLAPAVAEGPLPLGGARLRSRVAIGGADDRPAVDVGVTCYVLQDNELHCELVNAGAEMVFFRMPELTDSLRSLQEAGNLRKKSEWDGDPQGGYVLPPTPDRPQAFVANVLGGRFRVKPTRLELLDANRKAIGHGRVSVYLPETPR